MKTKYTRNVLRLTFVIILSVLSVVTIGCMNMNHDDNGVRQQGTQVNRHGNLMQQQGQADQQENMDHSIQVADQAADKIVDINGVRQANVLVTQRKAYVFAVLDDNQGKLTREVEDQIAQQVRATDPNIENVYVSTNPDLADRINTYVDDVQQGRPVAGFVEQFNEMVQRLFPNDR